MDLLFAVDQKFLPLLYTCLHSIARSGGEERYGAYVLHSDLTQEDMRCARRQAGPRFQLRFIPVDEALFRDFPESSRYPRQIYYRLAAPLLLPLHLDRILYLDVDLVVINPLREFYGTDFEGNCFVACSHAEKLLTRFNQLRLGVEDTVPYINTGVLLMNLPALRRCTSLERLRETAQQKMHTLLLPDQDLLTVLHGQHIKLADTMRYNLSDRMLRLYNADPRNTPLDLDWVRQNAAIIHYYGKNKPWKPNYSGILDVFYREVAEEMAKES